MKRRNFLIKSGIGLGVMLGVGVVASGPTRRMLAKKVDEEPTGYSNKFDSYVWFQFDEAGQLVLHSPKVEMGQGVFTALAQIAGEELGVAWEDIKVVHATTGMGPVDPISTGGSLSVSSLWVPLRELAAQMREVIKTNAATSLGTKPESITFEKGYAVSGANKISFADLAKKGNWKMDVKTPKLKDKKDFKLIGQPKPRLDLEAKVKGVPMYGIDASFPRMVYASVLRPPHIGASASNVDTADAKTAIGVIDVVIEGGLIAVVAKSRYHAEMAKRKIKVNWTNSGNLVQQSDIDKLIKVGVGKDVVVQKNGATKGELDDSNTIIKEYSSPFGVHGHIEPNGAIAHFENGKLTVKMSTQVAALTQRLLANKLNLKEENVDIQTQYLGGGFGRRLDTAHALEAGTIAMKINKPVSVFYERSEEFQNGFLRPPTHNVLKAKLDANGKIQAIEHHTASADVAFDSPLLPVFLKPMSQSVGKAVLGADFGAWRGGFIHYKGISKYQTIAYHNKLPLSTSWWRGLGLLANTFAIESFMDELAHQTKQDALQFRLNHLDQNDERNQGIIGVLQAVKKMSNWPNASAKGRALGLACSIDVNTPVAQVVEVELVEGQIKVHKVWCAIDPGIVINPDGVKAQVEGAINMGLSASVYEEVQIVDGKVTPNTFGFYAMSSIKDAPVIETEILSTGDIPRGVGEPPIGPIGGAIANAVFNLTQKRINRLPLQKHLNMAMA